MYGPFLQVLHHTEWMNQWMHDWTKEWMNERTNEWMNEWMNEHMHEWMNEWMNEKCMHTQNPHEKERSGTAKGKIAVLWMSVSRKQIRWQHFNLTNWLGQSAYKLQHKHTFPNFAPPSPPPFLHHIHLVQKATSFQLHQGARVYVYFR